MCSVFSACSSAAALAPIATATRSSIGRSTAASMIFGGLAMARASAITCLTARLLMSLPSTATRIFIARVLGSVERPSDGLAGTGAGARGHLSTKARSNT